MPPRKLSSTSSTGKRKLPSSPPPPKATPGSESELSELSEEEKPSKAKKAKKGPVTPIHKDLPNNTAFPDPLEPFERPQGEGTIRIAAWNVAGLKACEKKGFSKYVEAEDADILVLTETKCDHLSLPSLDDRYPYRYWGTHHKKGLAGTAIFSKLEPINVTKGLPTTEPEIKQKESEGRIVTLEFEKTFVIGTYVPNAGQGLKTLLEKASWNKSFETYLRQLDSTEKSIIWIGDINVVPGQKDIRNWKTNYNKSAGCTDTEIDGFHRQLRLASEEGDEEGQEKKKDKLVDVWRERKGEELEGHYSYFSYKFQCRSKGIGWRIDAVITSQRLLEKVKQCEIRQSIYGASDHVPIMLDIEGPL